MVSFCLLGAGCGEVAPGEPPGSQRDRQGLAPLQSPCVFTAATGGLVIVLAAGEQGYLERRSSDSALLINGEVCNTSGGAPPFARSSSALQATISGAVGGGETMVLDYLNGLFLRGSAVAPGVVIDLGGGGDQVQVRMSPSAERVRAGVNGWDVSGDGTRDLTLVNVAAVTLTLGDGDATFSAAGGGPLGAVSPSSLPITVFGGTGNDRLTGGDGDDDLYGDQGEDLLNGGASLTDGDSYSGGAGRDTVTYASRVGAVTVTVGAGADDGAAGEQDDVGADVEVVTGGQGDDAFTGWAGPQTFYGGPGDDTFDMGLLAGTGAGADAFFGEGGEDAADYRSRLEAVTVTMDSNAANDGAPGEGDNVRSDVEHFLCPAAAVTCTVTGNALDNHLTGGGGDDVLSGGAGDDTFFIGPSGGTGAGADSLTGGAGIDWVDFTTFGAPLDVRMDAVPSATQGKRIALDVEDLACPTATACTVTGNARNNHLWGSTQLDTLSSGGGDDLVETGGGADVVDCGDGSDILIGAGALPVGVTCEL